MYICPSCGFKISRSDLFCRKCGISVNMDIKTDESYELKPRFVFAYELLPSSFSTVLLLVLTFIVSYLICNYFHFSNKYIIILFAFLFILKDFKVLYRKFKYRNVSYIISNTGIEYSNYIRDEIKLFIDYSDITDVLIQRNLATYLFGYGHILVKSGHKGICLDYIASVDKVYNYILNAKGI